MKTVLVDGVTLVKIIANLLEIVKLALLNQDALGALRPVNVSTQLLLLVLLLTVALTALLLHIVMLVSKVHIVFGAKTLEVANKKELNV